MKRLIRKSLASLGLDIRRLQKPHDAFAVQKRLLPSASVVFDVGANVGDVSHHYRRLYPEATIYAFEPLSSTAAVLRERTRDSVKVVEMALSDHSGEAVFHSNKSPGTNSLFRPTREASSFYDPSIYDEIEEVTVPLTTIDEFCVTNGVEKVDILKMDIQGAELLTLTGAERMLGSMSLVYTEVFFEAVYEGQAWFADIFRFLTDRGFWLHSIYGLYYAPDGRLVHADSLFVRSKSGFDNDRSISPVSG